MTDTNSVRIEVICDCGEKHEVGIAGIDLDTVQFSCPRCGEVNGFTADQVADIVSRYELAAEKAREAFRNAFKS
ncbi:hypothetical protein NAC44_11870 [Allorhizobium sp. BGMRC 0089]|uniref:hypothetical protein n=1 Tax=Allorhizobium sonneratiae TaxID=2934936 RepID=UPI00203409CA|nr:hypothetical protein [Allorhizobium sonneratiae]MCM2293019.1 hypothetical protein [Allorhizobium sonneratiae]